MPELPEVETVRAVLEREVAGSTITGVTERDFPGVTGDMTPAELRAVVSGRQIGVARRRGKYLLLPLDDGSGIMVHLRMTGRLLVAPTQAAPVRFEHLAIHLDSGMDLRFADQRKFGRVEWLSPAAVAATFGAALGPEPLGGGFTRRYLAERMRGRTAPIKAFLLDQRHVAGLGNIYVDEALFLSRIHPLTPAGQLDERHAGSLVRSIRRVLRSGIEHRGTTFSSFEDPYGGRGSNADYLNVYGRAKRGLPCVRCGTPLAFGRVAGRGTSWCPRCQRLTQQAPQP